MNLGFKVLLVGILCIFLLSVTSAKQCTKKGLFGEILAKILCQTCKKKGDLNCIRRYCLKDMCRMKK
ncbi:hypothetical protein SNE40_003307 [Patella caerulea]|uniref:Uncharacterized protein n=1 Tax=Patella caerulea TaxID=87958 RepID=A0AAN8KE01_PATCE